MKRFQQIVFTLIFLFVVTPYSFAALDCTQCHAQKDSDIPFVTPHNLELSVHNKLSCLDCHASMTKYPHSQDSTFDCSACHQQAAATYLQSRHGKVRASGDKSAATCSDCHGSHDIRSLNDPASVLSVNHRQNVCGQCHPGATQAFSQTLVHVALNEASQPVLYYVTAFFKWLLYIVFGFWGVHSVLWLVRNSMQRKKSSAPSSAESEKHYLCLSLYHRVVHILAMLSFMGLAATGLPLLFADRPWAVILAAVFGGVKGAGLVHRICAVVTLVYALMHVGFLLKKIFSEKRKDLFFGFSTLWPQKKDFSDCYRQIKWFLGLGPEPQVGRWPYWQKFHYWAIVWGVVVMSLSGLVLWFPEFFTQHFPGWIINLAQVIHSDEALLAIGFIFTIHFFNAHLKPKTFPMDEVIFTGRMTETMLADQKPAFYHSLVEKQQLQSLEAPAERHGLHTLARALGWCTLLIGLFLVFLIFFG